MLNIHIHAPPASASKAYSFCFTNASFTAVVLPSLLRRKTHGATNVRQSGRRRHDSLSSRSWCRYRDRGYGRRARVSSARRDGRGDLINVTAGSTSRQFFHQHKHAVGKETGCTNCNHDITVELKHDQGKVVGNRFEYRSWPWLEVILCIRLAIFGYRRTSSVLLQLLAQSQHSTSSSVQDEPVCSTPQPRPR